MHGRPVAAVGRRQAYVVHVVAAVADDLAQVVAVAVPPRRRPTALVTAADEVGLADGSGLAFEGQGRRKVKGLDRPIQVYRLA